MGKSLKCPGIRFKPTDDELVVLYLKKKLLGKKLAPEIIAEINIYDFSPWDLPAKSILTGDREWYFFCPTSKKFKSGPRKNRTTKTGYWKGTGESKKVKYKGRIVAKKKTLIFHTGRSPKGKRTDWVMHEYQMKDEDLANQGVAQEVEDRKGKKLSSEEDDGLSMYEKLVRYNQHSLSPDRFNCCSIEDFPDDDGYMVYDIWK